MSEQKICVTEVICTATCSLHGPITITYNTGATGFDLDGTHAIVRVGDTGTPSCAIEETATATTGSNIVDVLSIPVHRVGDSGTTLHSTYIITDTTTNIFSS